MELTKTEELFARIRQVRKGLLNPDTKEELVAAQAEATEIFKSEEFQNFVSLSTIYQKLG